MGKTPPTSHFINSLNLPITQKTMPSPKTQRARELRQNQTPYERDLWKLLRDHQLEDFGFRRQHPIGPYTADFACPGARLVIELDGASHDGREQYDDNRDFVLAEMGWTTLRFRNVDSRDNPAGVWAEIARNLKRGRDELKSENLSRFPHPKPPHKWRGDQS